MNTTHTAKESTNAEKCRGVFPPKLKRAQVMEMGAQFGITEWTMRCLIEGKGAVVKVEKFGGQKRGYFDRERLIEQLFPGE